MKKNIIRTFCLSVLCFATAMVLVAQEDRTLSSAAGDLYVISAKAGGVNYVEGSVAVLRTNGTSGYLVKGDKLEPGDKVSTAANSRIEVLMNPGSFVRLDQNSEFEFLTTSLDDLKLKVNQGSAIFEVFASNDFKITVNSPKAKFYLVKTGVYRVDVLANGAGKLEVHRGKAQVGNLAANQLKKGVIASVNGDKIEISRFNRKNRDIFENWSKSRAKLIVKANKKLVRSRLSNSLVSRNRGFNSRFNCFDSFGLWVFSQRYNSFSFLPFGNRWRSPYGFRFNTSTGICNDPFFFSRPRFTRFPTRRNGGNGTGSGTTNTIPAENVRRGARVRTPPFRRMERSGNANVKRRRSSRAFPTRRSTRTRNGNTNSSRRGVKRSQPVRRSSPRKSSRRPPLSSPKGRPRN